MCSLKYNVRPNVSPTRSFFVHFLYFTLLRIVYVRTLYVNPRQIGWLSKLADWLDLVVYLFIQIWDIYLLLAPLFLFFQNMKGKCQSMGVSFMFLRFHPLGKEVKSLIKMRKNKIRRHLNISKYLYSFLFLNILRGVSSS